VRQFVGLIKPTIEIKVGDSLKETADTDRFDKYCFWFNYDKPERLLPSKSLQPSQIFVGEAAACGSPSAATLGVALCW
jgi:hypothetical protein